jgi:hypothetical protein
MDIAVLESMSSTYDPPPPPLKRGEPFDLRSPPAPLEKGGAIRPEIPPRPPLSWGEPFDLGAPPAPLEKGGARGRFFIKRGSIFKVPPFKFSKSPFLRGI